VLVTQRFPARPVEAKLTAINRYADSAVAFAYEVLTPRQRFPSG
jgi:hypothetical protein